MHSFFPTFAVAVSLLPALAYGQLSGSVGPLTSASTKTSTKTCDVTDYGAVADKSTDLGPPLASAFADCKTGGTVVVPEGDYALETWARLSGGKAWALQLDGTIYRTGTDDGNMIYIEHSSDFELFSSTSAGAFQGLGYEFHKDDNYDGPRILRLYDVSDFSVHDLALVDSPSFHFSMDTCSNGEVYNMAIRGGEHGSLDGIDVWSTNIWIHDVMVTNKDECVTVKSPSQNILIENIYCNWSGGCSFGSLGADTSISTVTYRNIYTYASNQMLMIKSNGGSGTVSDVVLENFIGRSNAYSLDIDQYWSSMSAVDGDGVQLTNISVTNWKGTESDGAERGPVKVICADETPCTDIVIDDFAMWTESGDKQFYTCQSAYGSGFCLKEEGESHGTMEAYTATTTYVSSAPTGYEASTMAEDLSTAFGTDASIPIPTIPSSFFPGATPYSALAGSGSAATSAVEVADASSSSLTASSKVVSSRAAVQTPVSTPAVISTPVAVSTPVVVSKSVAVPTTMVTSVASAAPSPFRPMGPPARVFASK
ncbi:glycoside hydrolase family 28 protein [Saccharata proteae CBS 121410]|uniref:rhamnogalacturonan hydrolase n=1 Tax=Saccharata proteae CBS 121410 TaxID=1314787 RepID=A0A9P4LZG8_9PEZI|nr:glycoside hydrolase family 28 protein [Saccharata proteae CBS 121410]